MNSPSNELILIRFLNICLAVEFLHFESDKYGYNKRIKLYIFIE